EVQEAVIHSHELLHEVLRKLDRIEETQREQATRLERVEQALSVKGRVRSLTTKLQYVTKRKG
ncbi:MAG: hypothetical protein Q3974_01465, partial [Rothia sp. (in: high G+C Gram-positive bacteria)]|nr:hypothetical protein [Rothia sp. (in: high G+C Gram-positive bacteria)]